MVTVRPLNLMDELESGPLEFSANFETIDALRRVEAALNRLGCNTSANGLWLRVVIPAHPAFDLLSTRELQLVTLASKGRTDKEIAGIVGLSINTVRSYWVRICHKLGANNRTHAVSIVLATSPSPEANLAEPNLSATE